MMKLPLVRASALYSGYSCAFEIDGHHFLLLQHGANIYLIENRCGHFGVALNQGEIVERDGVVQIICPRHGISFDLASGAIANRPWENCAPVKVYQHCIENGQVYALIDDR